MKVDLLQGHRALNGSLRATYGSKTPNGSAATLPQDAPNVKISEDARWVAELQSQAMQLEEDRGSVVSEVQGQLVLGSFEESVDMDRVLENLLSDL